MNNNRNRATGWKYAKLSGHANESIVKNLFKNEEFKSKFSNRLGIGKIKEVTIGGINETNFECVLGGYTKSKTDLIIELYDNTKVNLSIKKSKGGQVYLIGVDRFIAGYEQQYAVIVPNNIKELLKLYFYGHKNTSELLKQSSITIDQSEELIKYQIKKGRLVWSSLINMNKYEANQLLQWFKDNAYNITDYCFSKGLSKNSEDWADYVWYINNIGEYNIDVIFSIADIKKAVLFNTHMIVPGKKNGGSTILMPFGFIQWHQKQMQFHHSLHNLEQIVHNTI